LIDGSDLVFLAKSKDGDYHQEMNSVVFLEWFENLLMPALKYHSLVVLDNASYHNVKTEDTAFVHTSFVIFPKAAYVSSLTSFNRKMVLFSATKPLTCAHINSIGFSSQCRTGILNTSLS
jgi:hypothetical protein